MDNQAGRVRWPAREVVAVDSAASNGFFCCWMGDEGVVDVRGEYKEGWTTSISVRGPVTLTVPEAWLLGRRPRVCTCTLATRKSG